ncbi:MAG: hypothetical protein NC084_13440 [Bacteroides sp.]|nr:hypothetical protein [Eubacterium sp.]MCM1418952.1 hypothetical protein [Roseburia sp.]MCM1463699.1 hypothetical protein [Bacteroides sp.]
MKKTLAFLLTIFTIFYLDLAAIPAFADGTIRARHLASSQTDFWRDYKTTVLFENVTAKKTVTVADDENLVIRKGVTLRLKDGARVDGAILIERGAKLVLSGGTLTVSGGGALLADGTLSVGKKATLSVRRNGELVIGQKGNFKVSDDESLRFASSACVICLGKCDSDNAAIGKKAVAAYVLEGDTLSEADQPDALLPTGADYRISYGAKSETVVTFIFDSGASLRAVRDRETFSEIGSCPVGVASNAAQSTYGGKSLSRIYEIDGKDYVGDLEMDGAIVLLEKDGTFKETDETALPERLHGLSLDRAKDLGALGQYVLGKGIAEGIKAYLFPDGTLLTMSKAAYPPPALLDAPQETRERVYHVELYRAID